MISWQSKYEIGIVKIDFEHKTFLSLIVDFSKQIEENSREELLINRIKEIKKHAEFHFFCEENLMREIGYPDLSNHHVFHQELLKEIDSQLSRIEKGSITPKSFLDFVLEWFAGHTTQEDIRIAKFLKKDF